MPQYQQLEETSSEKAVAGVVIFGSAFDLVAPGALACPNLFHLAGLSN